MSKTDKENAILRNALINSIPTLKALHESDFALQFALEQCLIDEVRFAMANRINAGPAKKQQPVVLMDASEIFGGNGEPGEIKTVRSWSF